MSCQVEYRGLFIFPKQKKKVDDVLFALNAAFKKNVQWHRRGIAVDFAGTLFSALLSLIRISNPSPHTPTPSPLSLSISTRQMPHSGTMQLLYRFTKQETEEKSMDAFLLTSFGDINETRF